MPTTPIAGERDLWRIWEERRLPAEIRTREGRRLRVLFPGLANTGPGPDFMGALFALDDGEPMRGDVELHLKASSWDAHRHHQDPRYIQVRLHVVLLDDGGPARTLDDASVPVVALGPLLEAPPAPDQPATAGPCMRSDAPRPAQARVQAVVKAAGAARFAVRAARWEGEWHGRSAEDCVLRALIHTVGLGRNADACTALADALDAATLESLLAGAREQAPRVATAILLGMAGLLEQARADDTLRQTWALHRDYWSARPLDSRRWQRFRLRPTNLPETRLRTVAAVLAQDGLCGFLERISALVEQPGVTVAALLAPLLPDGASSGRGWALESWTNVLLPLLAGRGHAHNRALLATRALEIYGTLPGGGENRILERMVAIAGLPHAPRTAIEQQGLLQIWQDSCGTQACAACPLATLAPA
ncbi:MAG TPA: DUF2851 family protein [Chloroflexota bacterium]|jgi:hypothetical protein|nr:DUF2851 family protein [Chloroflexota bacterium]